MKKTYEKPVIKILKMDNSMQMICASGVNIPTTLSIGKWDKTDEINAEGESKEISDDESKWPSLD